MKKVFSVFIAFVIVISAVLPAAAVLAPDAQPQDDGTSPVILAASDSTTSANANDLDVVADDASEKDYSHLKGTKLNVYNWGEYIADGGDDSMDVNKAFYDKYGIQVVYDTYATNEEMHTKVAAGGANYDIIIPSDYMIERMVNENLLKKLDFSNIPNYKYIAPEYKNLYFDALNEYSVPYMAGMVGLIYNTKVVKEAPDSWAVMWDAQYKGKILGINNPRDCFGIAQFFLGQDVNTTNTDDWNAAFDKLKEQKPLLQTYVMDEVFDKMESGEASLVPYYAGDYYTMLDTNPDLGFAYPKEGTNIFVDSVCIPNTTQNKEAAELYINFLLEPEIALENAEYICYSSPNMAVRENEDYSFKDDELLYPAQADMVPVQYFHDLPTETRKLMDSLWNDLKISTPTSSDGEKDSGNTGLYVALAVVAVLIVAVFVYMSVKKKRQG